MGLSSRAVVRRLRAWHLGEPLTRGQSIHTATTSAQDRLSVAFLKMGGETRPWAVAWKHGTDEPEFRFVPEPRERARVDAMAAELGGVLAEHLRHPAFAGPIPEEPESLAPLRQLWVPNDSHLTMLHHFAYSYSRRKLDQPHAPELRLLGRTALFCFLEAQRPGQQLVIDAGAALRSAYDFPAEDSRQAHLGFLLAWLSARGDRDHGIAAALDAERFPVSSSLLPALERTELAPLVEAHDAARDDGNESQRAEAESAIGDSLRPELERRLALVDDAVTLIATDPRPVNRGVSELVAHTLDTQFYDYLRPEERAIAEGSDPWVDSPETDFNARGAARRYFTNDAAADRMFAALVHDDRELEAEAIAKGRAFRGTITSVDDESETRAKTPVWRLEDPTPGPLSLRAGDRVCTVGHAKRVGIIRAIESSDRGALILEIEITSGKNAASAADWPHSMSAVDDRWIGQVLTVIGTSFADMSARKASMVWAKDLPGDWLIQRAEPAAADAEAAVSVGAES